ncbi:hypothetical protein JTE90_019045 [Oedothorax gibbosus]|uniref:Uncharacterized protein n=1 Tax=Oedothorax gibbosus TaxID=931172 RepID=A0AAV6UXS9_9ARAC|nr:hypothetical protein JTE90_019045 [Oedothorax gibbosus]
MAEKKRTNKKLCVFQKEGKRGREGSIQKTLHSLPSTIPNSFSFDRSSPPGENKEQEQKIEPRLAALHAPYTGNDWPCLFSSYIFFKIVISPYDSNVKTKKPLPQSLRWKPLPQSLRGNPTTIFTWKPLPQSLRWKPLPQSYVKPLPQSLRWKTPTTIFTVETLPQSLRWKPLPQSLRWKPLPQSLRWKPLPQSLRGKPLPQSLRWKPLPQSLRWKPLPQSLR